MFSQDRFENLFVLSDGVGPHFLEGLVGAFNQVRVFRVHHREG